MRKVIQIAASESDNDQSQFALCDDGSMWKLMPQELEDYQGWINRTHMDEPNRSPRVTIKPIRWERLPDVSQE